MSTKRAKVQKIGKRGKGEIQEQSGKGESAFCHEKGPQKKDCPKLKKKDKNKESCDACIIECEGDISDSEFFLVDKTIASFDEWILDTGRTYHMRSNKQWFLLIEFLTTL